MIRNYEKVMNVEVAGIQVNFTDAVCYKCFHSHLDLKHFLHVPCRKSGRAIRVRLGLDLLSRTFKLLGFRGKIIWVLFIRRDSAKALTCLASVQDVNKLTTLVYSQIVSTLSHLFHMLGHLMAIVAQNKMLVFISIYSQLERSSDTV